MLINEQSSSTCFSSIFFRFIGDNFGLWRFFVRSKVEEMKLSVLSKLILGSICTALGTFDGELLNFLGLNAEMYASVLIFLTTLSPCKI